MRILTELDAHCRRVLGVLLEKEQTTPDYYPLTLNALIAACNQTTNRDPVMSLKRFEVLDAVHALGRDELVQRVAGPRADRWAHMLIQKDLVRPAHKALLTVLLLRGAQTVGELKARTDRMHAFENLGEVEETLRTMSQMEPPLVRELGRRPGQKETRWRFNAVGEAEEEAVDQVFEPAPAGGRSDLEERVARLEEQVKKLYEMLGE